MRVLLSGYYGFGNLGDEALLAVIVDRTRRRFPSARFEVLSATPQTTAARFGVEAVSRWDWRAVRAAIARADVVLSGGGGLLQNATSLRSLLYYAGILREAIRTHRKTMMFAQSVGPLDFWGRLVVAQFCKGLDRATVRDERSRRLLQRLVPRTAVEQTADPVFLYDLPSERADLSEEGLGPESGPYAVISMRKSPGGARVGGDRRARGGLARTAPRHSRRVSAAGRRVRRGRLDRRHSRVRVEPGAAARVHAGEGRGDSARRSRRRGDAAAFADPGGALRRSVPRARLRSEGERALRGPRVSRSLRSGAARAGRPADGEVDAAIDRLVRERDALSAGLLGRRDAVRAAAERNFEALGELVSESGRPS